MTVQPVQGWSARISDLGLPDNSRIATSDDPSWSSPFIGQLGDRGFFLASSNIDIDKHWWLVGVDVKVGKPVFAPVLLDAGSNTPKCLLNGPGTLLCLVDDVRDGVVQKSTAWVIDARTGAVTFNGPTQLRTSPGELKVQQIGIYAIAETKDQGVYGVGSKAESTWFVPGDGSVADRGIDNADTQPQDLAAQVTGGSGSDRMVVFSLIDGTVVTPDIGQGAHPQSAVVYPGGFAVETTTSDGRSTPDSVGFFDTNGSRLGQAEVSGLLSKVPADLPIIESSPSSTVFSADGTKLAEVPGSTVGGNTLLIGDRLFVREASGETLWQQYALATGDKGSACEIDMGGYIGTDGATGLFETGNPNIGVTTTAVDLASCNTLWTISSSAGLFRDVWRVNTTLVQLSDDGTGLMSLVAPN